jgi:hypothetical protein
MKLNSTREDDRIPFLKNGRPSVKFILFLSLFILILYFLVYTLVSVEERTREFLLLYTCLGFICAHYLYHPFMRILQLSPFTCLLGSTILLLVVGYYSLETNKSVDALLKWLFLFAGATLYVYTKHILLDHHRTNS